MFFRLFHFVAAPGAPHLAVDRWRRVLITDAAAPNQAKENIYHLQGRKTAAGIFQSVLTPLMMGLVGHDATS
jgi:hypothetical protein